MKANIKKHRRLFKSVVRTIDKETGELTEVFEHFVKEVHRDDFVKFYVNNTGILLELKDHEIRFILALLEYLQYDNVIFLTKEVKIQIAKVLGKSVQRINDTVTDLVKKEALYRMSNSHYTLTPDIAFRGNDFKREGLFKRLIEIRITDERKADIHK